MSGPVGPFPFSHKLFDGHVVRRLGAGNYHATQFGKLVTLHADSISASGIRPQARLVRIPTFTEPNAYALYVDETMPQLLNLFSLSAEAHFASDRTQTEIDVYDAQTGEQGPPKKVTVQNLKMAEEESK